jgi:hypothetical protein
VSSNKFTQAVTILIKPSRIKQGLIVIPHLLVIMLLSLFLSLNVNSMIYFLIPLIIIALSFVYFVKLYLTLSLSKSVSMIHKTIGGSWSLSFKEDIKNDFLISETSFSSNIFLILNFYDKSNNTYTVLITPDSVDKDQFRRLKVLLKTRKKVIIVTKKNHSG